MTNTKNTKKALISSALALLLCCSMLSGTTFAWFTDEASITVNKIQAGVLDVALQDADGNSLEGKSLKWLSADDDGSDDWTPLWEPGCSYSLQTVTIKNMGDLSLKYMIVITGIDGDAQLNDVIDWTITVEKEDGTAYTVALEESHSLLAGAADKLTISGHMKESAGNQYMGMSINGISVTVYATQYNYENDSNGNTYDENAQYPCVSTQEEFDAALADNASVILLSADADVALASGAAKNKSVTIIGLGEGTAVLDLHSQATYGSSNGATSYINYQDGANLTFKNLYIVGNIGDSTTEGPYGGLCGATSVVFEDCTIENQLNLYGNTTFTNCVFNNTMASQYSIWTWGYANSVYSFDGCTFKTSGKAILVYGGSCTMNVSNCTFLDSTDGAKEKGAIEVGANGNSVYTLNLSGNSVYGFAINAEGTTTTGTKLYGNKNDLDAQHLIVTVSGTTEGSYADAEQ